MVLISALLGLVFFNCLQVFSVVPLFAGEGRMLVFGRVQDDPVRAIKDRQEFVDYLAKRLASVGISGGKILVVDKLHTLAQALKEDKVDLFHDSLVPTVVLAKRAGAVPILRQWKYGEADYESVIIVKKNSGINALADLKGKTIAFEEPHSTSAHVLARMLLEEKKFKLVQIKSPGTVKSDAIGYFHGSDGNSPNLLITGRADAATTTYREIERLKPEIRENLQILAKSVNVPRQIVAIHKGLDAKIAGALKEVLINMDNDPEGKGVLKRQQNTTKFDAIPPAALNQLKDVERYIFSSLGKEVDSW
jgi:phosphonate transport system substrate-binding protein